jgi:hypothetical protein
MPELIVDFITSLDGYASGEDWPGWWGLQASEYHIGMYVPDALKLG